MSKKTRNDNALLERKQIKVELLTFTYGTLLVRLTKDIKDINELNTKIELIGYDIGKRLIDDLIDDYPRGLDPSDQNKLMEKLICQLAQYYLGIIGNYSQTGENEFHLKFTELCYSNIICGIMRGMLEISGFEVKCELVKDKMKGDDINDMKIALVKYIEERFIDDEE